MARTLRASDRPTRVGVFQAIRRYPALFATPIVFFVVLGGLLGYLRTPTYTATAQLSVGQLTITDPAAIGSVIQATQQLASVYSRAIDANSVQQDVLRRAGRDASGSSLGATPLPQSPLIKVTAKSSSESKAVRVANAGAQALIGYAQRFTRSGNVTVLFTRFRAAALKVAQLQHVVDRATRAFQGSPTDANKRELDRAQADLEGAQVERDALKLSYQSNQQTVRSAPALQTFSVAAGASNDRWSKMQLLLLLGLIAGVAVGAALTTARLNRRVARLTRP
jgi:capsular polysaccharide biosynthesis protein